MRLQYRSATKRSETIAVQLASTITGGAGAGGSTQLVCVPWLVVRF